MPGEKKDKQLRLRMTEEEYQAAREYAESRGLSVSALLRWLLRRFTADPYSLSKQDVENIKAQENSRPSRRRKPPAE